LSSENGAVAGCYGSMVMPVGAIRECEAEGSMVLTIKRLCSHGYGEISASLSDGGLYDRRVGAIHGSNRTVNFCL